MSELNELHICSLHIVVSNKVFESRKDQLRGM